MGAAARGESWVSPFRLSNVLKLWRRGATSTLLMASKSEEKKDICDTIRPSSTQADIVAIRLEVDDLCPLPPSVQDLAYNSAPDMEESEEAAHDTTATLSTCLLYNLKLYQNHSQAYNRQHLHR